jgi:hypothetical protein
VLGKGFGENVATGSVGNEVQFLRLDRIQHSRQRRATWIADRAP